MVEKNTSILTSLKESFGTDINLRRKKGWVYNAILFFIFMGSILFLTSKFYIQLPDKINQTELNKPIKFSTLGQLTVLKEEYNPRTNLIQISFKIEGEENQSFKFKAQERNNPGVMLPVKELYKENHNYVIEVQKLSSEWGAIALDVYYEKSKDEAIDMKKFIEQAPQEDEKNEEDVDRLLTTIFTDQRKITVNDDMLALNKNEYEVYFVKNVQKDLKEKIKRIKQMKKLEEDNAKERLSEIEEIKKEIRYQTESEIAESKSKLTALESKIKDSEQNVSMLEEEEKMVNEKIKKLNEKANEASKEKH